MFRAAHRLVTFLKGSTRSRGGSPRPIAEARSLLEEILAERPSLHTDGAGGYADWGVSEEVARFLFERATSTSRSLETGCGLSTIAIALREGAHVAIAPWSVDLDSVRRHCRQREISLRRTRLIEGRSEEVLPALRRSPLDLVLIDGRHAFPSPFIDWYYTADRLAIGGCLVVDDLQLPSCAVLAEFLDEDEAWQEEATLGRTRVYRKLRSDVTSGEWTDQRWRRPSP